MVLLSRTQARPQRGFTLIEVMVAILVLAIGLLGLAGLHARMISAQFEAYQRAQAMMLAEDMASRIRTNPQEARNGDYALDGEELTGNTLTAADCNVASSVANDVACWSQAHDSMIGALGCIENISGSATSEQVVRVSVAWQGMTPTVVSDNACGKDAFGDDALRRVVSIDVTLAFLGEL